MVEEGNPDFITIDVDQDACAETLGANSASGHNPQQFVFWEEPGEVTDEELSSDDDGFGKIPADLLAIWAHLTQILEDIGLTLERLAVQDGDEPSLLTQLLEQGGYQVSKIARDWLMLRLLEKVSHAVEFADRGKRLRGSGYNIHMRRLLDVCKTGTINLDKEMSAPSLFFRPVRGSKPFRHLKDSQVQIAGAMSRADREKLELQKWTAVLIRKLMDARTPVYLQAETAIDPMAALGRAVGSIRASTLKTYLKRWQQLEVWCRRSYGLPWPSEVGQILDFIEILAEDLKPSVPQQTLQALQWMENTAGWTGEARLIHSPLVTRAFEHLVVEAGAGLQAKKQAPRFPFVALASLELFVKRDGLPVMRRIQGKSLLFRSYGTCRFDDLQNMDPDKLRKLGGLVVTELLRSKTSGAGKRNRELPIAISLEASLLGTDWLLTFLEDLEEVKEGPRDFLLQSSTYDGLRPRKAEKSYAESAAETMDSGTVEDPYSG